MNNEKLPIRAGIFLIILGAAALAYGVFLWVGNTMEEDQAAEYSLRQGQELLIHINRRQPGTQHDGSHTPDTGYAITADSNAVTFGGNTVTVGDNTVTVGDNTVTVGDNSVSGIINNETNGHDTDDSLSGQLSGTGGGHLDQTNEKLSAESAVSSASYNGKNVNNAASSGENNDPNESTDSNAHNASGIPPITNINTLPDVASDTNANANSNVASTTNANANSNVPASTNANANSNVNTLAAHLTSPDDNDYDTPIVFSEPDGTFGRVDGMDYIIMGGTAYIGVLSIPQLGLDLPINAFWSYPDLKNTPCRFSGNIENNTIVILAHNYKKHFSNVRSMAAGVPVLFLGVDGNVHRYQVAATQTVQPNEVEEVVYSGYDLTMFTCTSDGNARVVIRCMRE